MNSLSPAVPIPEPAILAGLGGEFTTRRKPEGCAFEIQSTLVPPVTYRGAGVELHGQTVPKDDVGGDLVDLVAREDDVIAYVADVSGHGLRAAVLMGMIKTAVRYGLHLGQPLANVLDHIDAVLPAVKQQNMFATLAALRFADSKEVEYISAGHVPLLHYRRRQRDVVRHSISQFPLGLFPGSGYTSKRIRFEPGDIFGLVTDGIAEAGGDQDIDLGLQRLGRIFCELPRRPLSEICSAVQADAGLGMRHDDETILLIRALPAE